MSYILDALKKSERQRPPGPVPDLFTVQGPRPPAPAPRWRRTAVVAALLLACVTIVALAWFDARRNSGDARRVAGETVPPVTAHMAAEPEVGRAEIVPDTEVPAIREPPVVPAPRPTFGLQRTKEPAASRTVSAERRAPVTETKEPAAQPASAPTTIPVPVPAATTVAPPPTPAAAAVVQYVSASPAAPPPPAAASVVPPIASVPDSSVPAAHVPAPAEPAGAVRSPPKTVEPAESGATAALPAPAKPVVTASAPEEAPPTDGRVLNFSDLPASVRAQLPKLQISGHVWSDEADLRLLTVDDRILHEGGEVAAGVLLQEITAEGAIFSYKSWRFRVAGIRP